MSDFVDIRSISVRKTGDKTLDSASFKLPQIGQVLTGLDVSRPFPRLARVKIKDDEFLLQTDTIIDLGGVYSHDIECVSVAKLLADTTNAGLTVTQPAGEAGFYYRTFSVATPDDIQNTSPFFMPLTTLEQSVDLSEIEDRTMKKSKEYQITFSAVFWTRLGYFDASTAFSRNIKVSIEVNGVVVQERTTSVALRWLQIGKIKKTKLDMALNYANTGTKEVKVKVQVMPTFNNDPTDIDYEDVKLAISASDNQTLEKITMDHVVEKILWNDANKQRFFLSENSKSLLKGYHSYEWTLPESYVWLHLTRVADYIKAFPTARYEDNKIMVDVVPFEDLAVEYEPIGVLVEGSQATIDDYAAALELNAENVYGENTTVYEKTTLRASGEISLLATDDLIIPTTQRIGEVLSMRVRIPAAITVGSISKVAGDWIDIDVNRILKQEYYNTLDSMSNYSGVGRFSYSKNNCLFFVVGEKNIRGVSYEGLTTKEMLSTTTYIRGIYELIIAQLTRDNGDSTINYTASFDNGTVARDNEIAVEISYRPYTATSATIYKSDQTGFQFTTTKFLNENASINSPDVIGTYAQGIADRSGGTVHSFDGECLYSELPDVLTTWGDMVLFGVSFTFLNKEEVSYKLQYIKEYAFISSYESYNPKERVYEIPKTNIIDRVVRKNNQIIFGTEAKTSEFNGEYFVRHLVNYGSYNAGITRLKHDNLTWLLLPLVAQAVGRVVELRAELKDNYSAGLAKYTSANITYQRDVTYTDAFGRVEDVILRMGYGNMPTTMAEYNALPATTHGTLSATYGTIETKVRKDARERLIYSYQVAYLSENNVIIIYDGIARMSSVVQQPAREVRWVEVNKIPNRQQKFINKDTIIRSASASLDVINKKITIVTIGLNPVVCYDHFSGEILLADTRKTTTRTIYYRGVEK